MSSLPEGVIVIEDFLDKSSLDSILHYAKGQIGVINKVDLPNDKDRQLLRKRIEGFYSERIYLHGINDISDDICRRIFGKIIPKYFGETIEWFEEPHIIRYRIGGTYKPHADADHWFPLEKKWVRGVDRDYSAILYLNDEFEGGTLYFPEHNARLIPKPGMLVCFPSNGQYIHTAEAVTKGNRYAFVTWAAAVGTTRVQNNVQNGRVLL